MLNLSKSYLKVWKVEDKGKFVKAQCTSGKKDKQTDTWINSNWNVRFCGKCLVDAKKLKEGDSVKIQSGIIENVWDKEKQRNWLNVVVFELEGADNNPNDEYPILEDEEELPF